MTKLFVLAFALALGTAGWLAIDRQGELSGLPWRERLHRLWLDRAAPPPAPPRAAALPPSEIVAPGQVEPVHDPVKLGFEAAGRIAEITVTEGEAVRAGQVLARLDDRFARSRVASAEANLAQAKAREKLARHGARPEEIAAARAEADAASAAARHRDTERDRTKQLGNVGAVAATMVDADEEAAQVAAAVSAAATARYRALTRGTRVEQIEEAAAAVALADAELAAAHVALDQTVLRAPQDGVILRRNIEIGALVTPSLTEPLLTMADLGDLEIRAEVDESDLANVAVGQTAYATCDAYTGRRFSVAITRVTRELGRRIVRNDDPRARVDTRVLEVITRFTAPPSVPLPLGMRMLVHIPRP